MKLNPMKTLGWFLTCHSIGQADRQSVSQSVTWKQRNGLIYTCILVFFMLACSQQQLHLSHNQQYFLSIQANKGLQISALDETFIWPIYIIYSLNKTKLSFTTSTETALFAGIQLVDCLVSQFGQSVTVVSPSISEPNVVILTMFRRFHFEQEKHLLTRFRDYL